MTVEMDDFLRRLSTLPSRNASVRAGLGNILVAISSQTCSINWIDYILHHHRLERKSTPRVSQSAIAALKIPAPPILLVVIQQIQCPLAIERAKLALPRAKVHYLLF